MLHPSVRVLFAVIQATFAFLLDFIRGIGPKHLQDGEIITDDFISRPLMVILLIIYPLTDTLRASLIRMYKGRSPFLADRVHLHHRLIDKGLSHYGASTLILMLSISVLLLGFLLSSLFSLSICSMLIFVYLTIVYYVFFN